MSLNSDLTINNNFTIGAGAGTFSAGTHTINVGGNFTNNDTFTIGASSGTGLTVTGNMTLGTGAAFTCSGNSLINVAGTWDASAGTFTPSTSTVTFTGTGWGITNTGTLTFYNLTIAGTPLTQPTASFGITGTLTVNNGVTFAPTAGTITFSGTAWGITNNGTLTFYNLTINGTPTSAPTASFGVAGALIVNSSSLVFSAPSNVTFKGLLAQNITSNGAIFNTVTVTNVSAGGVSFLDQMQCANFTDITAGSGVYFAPASSGNPHTILTTLTITGGAGSSMVTLGPLSGTTNVWYIRGPPSTTVTGVNVSYSTAVTNAITANSSNNGGNNTNWIFGAVTRYWVASSTHNWNSTTYWSDTSGGSGGYSVPTTTDTAIFNSGGVGDCSINIAASVATLNLNLGYSGTLSIAVGNSLSVSGAFTLAAGGFTQNNNAVAMGSFSQSGGTFTGDSTVGTPASITDSGDFTISGGAFTSTAGTLSVAGNWSDSGAFTANGGTVTFNGATTQNITSGGQPFYNLTVNGSGSVATLIDNASVGGALNVQKGTLAVSTLNLSVTGTSTVTGSGGTATVTIAASGSTGWTTTGNFTVGASGTVTCTGASLITVGGSWDVSAGTFTASTSTLTFTAVGTGTSYTVKSGSNKYYNVTWNGATAANSWTLQDNFGQNSGNVTSATNGTLNLNGNTYTLSAVTQTITLGSFTLNIGTGIFDLRGVQSLIIPSGAAVTISSGVLSRVVNFTVSGTGTLTATGAATIDLGSFTVSDTATFTANAATIRVSGNVSITSTNFNAGTSTLYQYGATKTLSVSQPLSLYNYQVGYSTNASSISLSSDLTVSNNFTILANSGNNSFSAGSHTIYVGGNWANGDTFTANTSTVTFNDATKTSTISGNTTFNILNCSTGDKVIHFTAGTTQTVASFALTGASGHLITIDTDTGAGTFNLSDSTGIDQVYYTRITRSAASGGASWLAYFTDGNIDGGSNSGWVFASGPATYYWVNGAGNWSDPTHWSLVSGGGGGSYVPTSVDSAVFDANSGAGASTVDSGFAGTINNFTTSSYGGSVALAEALAVSGNFLHQTGTVAISTYNLSVTGNSTVTGSSGTATVTIGTSGGTGWTTTDLTIGASGVVTCSGNSIITASGSWDSSAGTFTYSTSTVNLTGTGNLKTAGSGNADFYNLTMAASGKTTTLQSTVAIANVCTLGSGTLSGATYDLDLLGSGTPLVHGGAAITLMDLIYKPTTGPVTVAAGNYGTTTLMLQATSSNLTFNLAGDVTVNGTFWLFPWIGVTNEVCNTQNHQLNVGVLLFGIFSGTSSTLNAGSSTINISGLSVSTNGGHHTLNLQTANLTCSGDWKLVNVSGTITLNSALLL